MATTTTNGTEPWGDGVPAKRLWAEWYWVDYFPDWYWYITAALCFGVPPAGLAILAYLSAVCVTHESEDIPAELEVD